MLYHKIVQRFASKVITDPKEVLSKIQPGSTLLCGGFGICGIPENLIATLKELGTKDLTCVSNNAGIDDWGLGLLLKNKQIRRMVSSYVGENAEFERQYLQGELELELVPQGTLAEKCRSGGAGIPAFYTSTGVGTMVENGGFPIKYKQGSQEVEIFSEPKQTRIIDGKKFVMEESIFGDYALIKAWKADTKGNLVFRRTSRNFNADMASASKCTIAEVEEIVEAGQINPDEVHVPGVFVDHVYLAPRSEKRIEKITTNKSSGGGKQKDTSIRDKIITRAAKEIKNGMYINLGIGIPTLLPQFLDPKIEIELQSENGILGVGAYPEESKVDADLINAGKVIKVETISLVPGSSTFSSAESFGIIRGGHLDLTILGAMQVSRYGDIANWIIPGKLVKGMGGAMDLVSCGSKVMVVMNHTAKGAHKILEDCSLPKTGERVVDMLITEKAVFEKMGGELVLTEIAKGHSLEEIRSETGYNFKTVAKIGEF